MTDKLGPSTNELMKRALAIPLSGDKQIVPLVLPKVHPDTERDFRLWLERMRRAK